MFRQIQGNARTCVLAEPLFVVPASLYTTYASVYMLHLHVTDTQIGLITTLNLLLQIISAFISGHLTDRLGRRKALWVFDLLSWSLGALLWAVAQNFWWFVIAAMFNSMQRIPTTAWYCLLVEDTPAEKRRHVFTGLQIVSVLGGLFAPIGGVLVAHFTLVPAVRIMYVFFCISATIMIYVRHRGMHETEIGLRKMKETGKANFGEDFKHYLTTLKQIFRNRTLLLLFFVYVLWNFQVTISNTFVPVYQVEFLHIPAVMISLFPAISSAAIVVMLLTVVPRFREEQAKTLMNIGFLFLIAANVLLIVIPAQNFALVVVSTVLAAVGTIISNPYLESVVANAIDDEHRSTMLSVLNVLILVFASPAGIIGGWTYSIDAHIPIGLIIAAFVVSIVFVRLAKRRSDLEMRMETTAHLDA
ncbi:MFS transporter [Alicyclobacillus ferrooxydans]|uniref:MFS transporter n=1 Tax=Alicyclobacillus ferrooxydans TaxID=471514 RepID=A0A0P9CEG4_9BACL|nr:MFS transporter [Alicyclobacillus ferrooxydans]KPV44002.1 MFS transporter [Alicyclobacillus ferrooxydans]